MSEHAEALQQLLIRNFNGAPLQHEQREPLYDTRCARLARGTAARKLGASIDIVAPGMRSCPYHFHHAEEEMFIILEATEGCAWPARCCRCAPATSPSSRPVRNIRIRSSIRRMPR